MPPKRAGAHHEDEVRPLLQSSLRCCWVADHCPQGGGVARPRPPAHPLCVCLCVRAGSALPSLHLRAGRHRAGVGSVHLRVRAGSRAGAAAPGSRQASRQAPRLRRPCALAARKQRRPQTQWLGRCRRAAGTSSASSATTASSPSSTGNVRRGAGAPLLPATHILQLPPGCPRLLACGLHTDPVAAPRRPRLPHALRR